MSPSNDGPQVSSVEDLYAIAFQIEVDAVERYTMLAEQMDTHNNVELARVFRDLARAEGIHTEEIRRQAGDIDIEARARTVGDWSHGDSPESADLSAAHYLMTPREALQMALAGEKRALAFFTNIADSAKDAKIRDLARELVEEEAAHVNLCYRLLQRYPLGSVTVAEDPDPPLSQG